MVYRPTPAEQRESLIAAAQDAVAEAPKNFRQPSAADSAIANGHVDVLHDGTTVIQLTSRSRPLRIGKRVAKAVGSFIGEIAEPSGYWESPVTVDARSFEGSTPEALAAADKVLEGIITSRQKGAD